MLQATEILHTDTRHLLSSLRTSFQTFRGAKLEALSKEWRSMVAGGPFAEPFYQPEWFCAYAQAFRESDELSGITTYRGGSLIGILPLAYKPTFFGSIPAHALCGISGLHSCRTDLIHAPNERDAVARETWKILRDQLAWTAIEVLDVPNSGAFQKVLELAEQDGFLTGRWETRKMPYLSIPTGITPPHSACPQTHKVVRSRLDKKLRRLHREGRVEFKRITTGDRSHVEQFLTIESSGWKGRRGTAIASSIDTHDFYEATTQAAFMRNYLRIYALEVNGKPISMYLGFVMNNKVFMPKIAYDERFAVYSPGQLLTKLVIEDLSREGISTLEFLGPRAPWKNAWTETYTCHTNCYIFSPTLRGKLLHLLTMRGAAALRPLKRKLCGDPQA